MRHDRDMSHGAVAADRRHGNQAERFGPLQTGMGKDDRAAPVGDAQANLDAPEAFGELIGDGVSGDGKMALGSVRKRVGVVDDGIGLQLSIMCNLKVLQINRIGTDHVPGTIDVLDERFRRDQLIGGNAGEERQGMVCRFTVEEINAALSQHGRKTLLSGKAWDRARLPAVRRAVRRDVRASTVSRERPMMKRALNRVVYDTSVSEVGAHVSTAIGQNARGTRLGQKTDQVFSQHVLRDRAATKLFFGGKVIPGAGIVRGARMRKETRIDLFHRLCRFGVG